MTTRNLLGLSVAAGAAALLQRGLRRYAPGGTDLWQRTNHAGSTVTLTEGLALVGGTAAAAAVTAVGGAPTAAPVTVVVTALGAGAVGVVDDLRPGAQRKGLHGHLAALAAGTLTSGTLKIVGLAGTGLAATALSDRAHPGRRVSAPDVLLGGAVVAGAANLANLLDLRPGRALKVALACGIPLLLTADTDSLPVAAVTGAALALLPDDLAGRSMLGDTGANPLGALVGLGLVQRQGRAARARTLLVVTGLTLLSELVSFTAVIDSTPVLRWLDRLGRQTS